MAKQEYESIPFVTPWFKARFPKISEPDTKGKYADGKFKTDGYLDDEAYAVTEKALKEAAKTFWPKVAVADVSIPLKPFYANAEDKKAKKADGRGFTLKSKRRPAVFDSQKKKLPEGVKIGGGSIIRVAATFAPWSKSEKIKVKDADGNVTVEETTVYGVTIYLNDVQVRKLVVRVGGDGEAFDADEGGFEYEDATDDAAGAQFDAGSATDL
jgi:DNA-directed RNA polymerase